MIRSEHSLRFQSVAAPARGNGSRKRWEVLCGEGDFIVIGEQSLREEPTISRLRVHSYALRPGRRTVSLGKVLPGRRRRPQRAGSARPGTLQNATRNGLSEFSQTDLCEPSAFGTCRRARRSPGTVSSGRTRNRREAYRPSSRENARLNLLHNAASFRGHVREVVLEESVF